MANREPVNYIVSYGEDANLHADWETLDEYDYEGAAKRAIEGLLPQGWSGKLEYVFANGIIEHRIFETSAHRGQSLPFAPDVDISSGLGLYWGDEPLMWGSDLLVWL